MFNFAILIGTYAYLILLMGFLGLLKYKFIFSATLIFFIIGFLTFIKSVLKYQFGRFIKSPINLVLICLLFTQAVVNLIGALGPELAFDALWYHLTLPKLYLLKQKFEFIEGGTLYYSTLPQLTEMFYTVAISLQSEILAKVIHYFFGLGICLAIYKFSRRYFDQTYSLLATAIFYSNLVVAWESITAYIDLARTFFEFLSFWALLKWFETKNFHYFIQSTILIGFAISTKILSIGTLLILFIIFLIQAFSTKLNVKKLFFHSSAYLLIAIIIPLPWFLHSYISTGNPFYGVLIAGAQVENVGLPHLNPLRIVGDFWMVFTKAADPLSPAYIILFPLVIQVYKKLDKRLRYLLYFCALSLVVWYITPRSGGGRFMLPFLPALSILSVAAIYSVRNWKVLKIWCFSLIIFTLLISILFRGAANIKYLKPVLGLQTKEQFLGQYLEFDKNNFADIDGYFRENIKLTDKVLLFGFHNLYYVNFPFIDGSWVKRGDLFNYIAVKAQDIPEPFRDFKVIYYNPKTQVKLYSNNGRWRIYK